MMLISSGAGAQVGVRGTREGNLACRQRHWNISDQESSYENLCSHLYPPIPYGISMITPRELSICIKALPATRGA